MSRTGSLSLRMGGIALAVSIVVGCASGPPAATNDGSSAERTTAKVSRNTAKFEQNGAHGFTVREVVRIGGDVRRDYQHAMSLLETEQFVQGAEILKTVIERAPEVTIPHIDLGMAYVQLGELDKAEASFRAALSLAPDHPVVLNELGILQRRTGRFDAARNSYEQALAVHPGFHYALLNLGVLCDLFLEDLGCALDNYSKYAQIVVNDPEVGIWIADLENRLSQAGGE